MTSIALIGCTSQKLNRKCEAGTLYSKSYYFNIRLQYAKLLGIPYIYVLSAKYGVVGLNDVIEPYNLNLKKTSKEYRKKWGLSCLIYLNQRHNLKEDTFYLLCGKEYRDPIKKGLNNTINPVPQGCRIGCQYKWYREEVKRLCANQ